MDTLLQDLRYTFRSLRRSPGFAAVAMLTLALGIGATTSIFSLGNALLNKQIHAAHPDRLARVYRNEHSPLTYPELRYLQETAATFVGLAGEQPIGVGVASGEGTERVSAALVTGNFFATLGVGSAAGRVFSHVPGRDGSEGTVAVLAHDYWRARFGGDPAVIGRTVRINDHPFTVLGVAEAGFTSSQLGWKPDIFLPLDQVGALLGTELADWQGTLYVTGRLAPGADLERAGAELEVLWERLRQADPRRDERMTIRVQHARGITAEARTPLAIGLALLLAMVGVVLLIACANVANLLLARATARRREIAARRAIGASRGRLVRQLLTESVTLAGLGGALGYGIAAFATRLFPRLLPERLPFAFDPAPDGNVLVFTAALGLLTGVLFGLAPALKASSPDLVSSLKDGASGSGLEPSRLRDALVVGQVTLCALALAMAGLFVRSLDAAGDMDPGFDPSGVLDLPLYLEASSHDAAEGARFYRDVVERLEARPAIRSATLARFVPLGGSNSGGALIRRGIDEADPRGAPGTYKNEVAPGYFEMLDIRILRGRAFDWSDGPRAPGVAILNRTAAERLWPGEDPIGRRVSIDDPEGPFLEVVGVVEDTKYNSPGEGPQTFTYLPLAQSYRPELFLHVRPAGSPRAAVDAVNDVLADMDPRIAVGPARPMDEDMSISLVPAKAGAMLLGIFGLLALIIAAIGVYGVTSYAVSRRTREIGVRAALGARRSDVLRLILRGTLVRVAIGLALGLVLAVGAGRLVSSLLYDVSPLDPASTVVAPAILASVALLAAYFPARRAARVHPMTALRDE